MHINYNRDVWPLLAKLVYRANTCETGALLPLLADKILCVKQKVCCREHIRYKKEQTTNNNKQKNNKKCAKASSMVVF